ncbi:hypothetical protein QYM36_005198 [Artemia franciscana]|uniref:Uncharacterized protein n=1 Tax=Artemia franciscana TaxID=6661 RepID=A0AA88I3U2_ARTSF|nr:hypothetical protein QYM36_005198 [Artemia franciscana]
MRAMLVFPKKKREKESELGLHPRSWAENLEVIEYPLDVFFMKSLSLHCTDKLRKWLRCNPGKVVTLFQISTIFGSAFIQSASMNTAINGFKATGIRPLNPVLFCDLDFLPTDTIDIQQGGPSTQKATEEPPVTEKEQVRKSSSRSAVDKEDPSLVVLGMKMLQFLALLLVVMAPQSKSFN